VPPTATPPEPPEEFPISDDYAKQFVLKKTGRADVVARMIHRVPTPKGPPSNDHFTTDGSKDIWGGYMADQNGGFLHRALGVFADFNVSQTCNFFCPLVGTWVGIGGFGNSNLAQTGVNQRNMQAFYEMLPAGAVYLYGVNNSDAMYTYLAWDSATNNWYFQVQDLTTATYWSSEFSYSPDTRTAEWITEVNGGSVPSMNPVNFTSARWIDETGNGHSIPDGVITAWRITLRDPNGGCVVPSYLSGTNDYFTNTAVGSC